MSKLTFKRLALVVVTALGLGVLSTGPSSAAPVGSSDTMTLSATSASITAGDTASVTITANFISQAAGDSVVVNVISQSSPTGGDGTLGMFVSDSANARVRSAGWSTGALGNLVLGAGVQKDDYDTSLATLSSGTYMAYGAEAANKAASVTTVFRFVAPTVAGTYTFRVYQSNPAGQSYTYVATPQTFTVTVTASTAGNSDVTKSLVYLNRTNEYTSSTAYASEASASAFKGLEADSALVVSAGTAKTPLAQAVLYPVVRNASDTKVTSVATVADGGKSSSSSTRIKDSVTVVITGPGLLAVSSYWGGGLGTKAKQVTMDWKESVVVYSDGTAGVGTITSYLVTSTGTPSSINKLSQAAKTITFVGRATTFTASAGSADVRAGSTILYNNAAVTTNGGDSVTAGTAIIRFLAKDASGNAVTAATLSTDPGESTGGFWAISSDTSVVAAGSTAAARKSPALTCNYDTDGTYVTAGYWYCSGNVYDSGTVTLTIVDSRTVTPNGLNYLTSTTGAVYKSDALSITFAGSGYTGTMALNKSSYNINEAATLTSTCKDASGRVVADGNSNVGCFSGLYWTTAAPTFTADKSVNAAGGTFGTGGTVTDLITYFSKVSGGVTWLAGTDTAMVFMPATAGTYTLFGKTAGATTASSILTFTVTDPVQDAQTAAIAAAQKAAVAQAAAAQAAADAATDAALQAIDAANAATDAANLAAEAADAATVAAQESKDAADAATAAVESLATQVATLMAALQAQITSLANVVAKIAKKVKA